ncbi:probable LRR receptor-like serine/threonine-protein kinase At4g20450 isoform X2 [Eutrema salsugineum]|uniref:probable LRR receptor-like serine/threonine-protein kinase At4g20450 isoform X2 n=1 Tax=Eutrema salsugineum TaxID=72664 RepID=UPI000CECE935|nr:probable LRR receptor-like serine/threonine-protein kinase At4g20450 isoform X2 [Eutrema salsugineum]
MESIRSVLSMALIGSFFIIHLNNAQGQLGFISLDCGMPSSESSYTENITSLIYSSDADFIRSGKSGKIKNNEYESLKPYRHLRYFPEGQRNCYNLMVMQGKTYLIRAVFVYGNYDGLKTMPKFDLYIGPNLWTTIDFQDQLSDISKITMHNGIAEEVIHMSKSNSLDICLVSTGTTTPFISALELRPLRDDSYATESGSLKLLFRQRFSTDFMKFNLQTRYPFDIHDRKWYTEIGSDWTEINTKVNVTSLDAFEIPQSVISKAVTTKNSSKPLTMSWILRKPYTQVDVYLHFADIQDLQPNDTRVFNILCNEHTYFSEYRPLEFMAETLPIKSINMCERRICALDLALVKAKSSTLPPLLNAIEAFGVIQLPYSETDENDIIGIKKIQATYKLHKINWQGDPCAPILYKWDGLNCTNTNLSTSPTIISLDLSTSGLIGAISPDIKNLRELQKLDLSTNNLTGGVPEFFSSMESLTFLDLSYNNLSGSVPQSLRNMEKKGLKLIVHGNPNLCLSSSCESNGKHENKILVPVLVTVAFICIIAVVFLLITFINRKKKSSKALRPFIVAKKRSFTYGEVKEMTDNFARVIGEGGFGIVYHGYLNRDEQVAAKVLSQSSAQGYEQFKAEVELLLRVHHINLVSLVGYCDEGDHLVLIYEYMHNEDLRKHLSGECARPPLSWKNRLRIAAETAQGLEYLHIGCKPPMIHRDVKSTNILIDKHFQAKLGDFGLSRYSPIGSKTHVSTNVVGSPGYLDPDFGIVLLEIITSLPVIHQTREKPHIVEWVGFKLTNGDIENIVDPSLGGDYSSSSMWNALELAMSCVTPSSSGRPNMSQVSGELKACIFIENSRKGGTSDIDLKNSIGPSMGFGPDENPDAR